jgi:dCMP deaminase
MNPKWDKRFLELAQLVAGWSKDPSTKTGAVIVRPDKSVLSLGFNGFPKGMDDNPKWYENRESKYSRIIHCEMNALIHAKESLEGCTLYTWPFASCDRCCVHMLQAGIKCFVFPPLPQGLRDRWEEAVDKTKCYIEDNYATWVEMPLEEKKENHIES